MITHLDVHRGTSASTIHWYWQPRRYTAHHFRIRKWHCISSPVSVRVVVTNILQLMKECALDGCHGNQRELWIASYVVTKQRTDSNYHILPEFVGPYFRLSKTIWTTAHVCYWFFSLIWETVVAERCCMYESHESTTNCNITTWKQMKNYREYMTWGGGAQNMIS